MAIEDKNHEAQVYRYYPQLDQEDYEERLLAVQESPCPEYFQMLHNMRTQAVDVKLSLDPDSSDFKAQWNSLTGRISLLTTLIGSN